MKKVLGIGNALVDILVKIDDDTILEKYGLPKGSMQLVDKEKSKELLGALEQFEYDIASGGSAANTINGLANLGLSCGYIGKIKNDEYGAVFRKDMTSKGIDAILLEGIQDTGIAITLITGDSQRTFATYLGAAVEMTSDDISDEMFDGYDIFHVEGYLVQNHDLIGTAIKKAKNHGLQVAIDLASYNVVESNLKFLKDLVSNDVDIVFANEEEAKAFTGKEPEEALHEIAGMCDIAVVKVGAKGSFVKSGDRQHFVGAIKADPVDTTGAGDLYAAGFLYGLATSHSLEKCAQLGSLLGGRVIEVIGPKMDDHMWSGIRKEAGKII